MVVAGGLTWALELPMGPLIGAAVAAFCGAWLHRSAKLRLGAYRIWSRLARRVSDLVAAYLTRLLFGIVTVVGIGGSRFTLGRVVGAKSNWTPKSTVRPEDYDSQHVGSGENRNGWTSAYLSWGLDSGRIWVWSLYPLIALLGMVQTQEKGSFGGNVYTLY